MTKRLNHTLTSTPNHTSSPETTQKRDASAPPKPDPSIPGPSSNAPPPPRPSQTSCVKKETKLNTQNQDKPFESKITEASEESESKTFDQVLNSLTELTDKHCKSMQVI